MKVLLEECWRESCATEIWWRQSNWLRPCNVSRFNVCITRAVISLLAEDGIMGTPRILSLSDAMRCLRQPDEHINIYIPRRDSQGPDTTLPTDCIKICCQHG